MDREKIHVLLVEDDPFWIDQLSCDIKKQNDMALVNVASTIETAIQEVMDHHPDIIVLGINLTDNNLDGIEIARKINKIESSSKIIMLSNIQDQDIILELFDLGVINYLSKTSSKDIIRAIREAYRNCSAIHADVAELLLQNLRHNRREVKIAHLTPAEREIFDLKEKGFTKTEMAEILHKSFETIKSQFKSIKKKLGESKG